MQCVSPPIGVFVHRISVFLLILFIGAVVYPDENCSRQDSIDNDGADGIADPTAQVQPSRQQATQDTSEAQQDSTELRKGLRREAEREEEVEGEERTIIIGDREVVIQGFMSLTEIEQITGVPASYLIEKLNLPADISRSINIGSLRRRYGFRVQDLRAHIREYLQKKKE